MPETCTCGAVLVEGARFCHKCGRPTFTVENVAETIAAPESPNIGAATIGPTIMGPGVTLPPRTVLASLPVGFGNPIALRVAFVMSLVLLLLQLIPGVNLLFALWWLGAGWGAVLIYQRITGAVLSVGSGARLGSITGVLTSLSLAILSLLALLFMGKDSFADLAKQDPQVTQVFNNPTAMAAVILLALALMSGLVTGICAAGGALGARFTNRPRPNG
jgi:hypothetical protein